MGSNRLLSRKQMVVDVLHPNRANVSRAKIAEELTKIYKGTDTNSIILFGFKTVFGGGRSSGFALIYDDKKALLQYEMKYRQVRHGFEVEKKKKLGRRASKEFKHKVEKVR